MEGATNSMIEAVTSALSQVITWIGSVITAITGSSGALNALLPLFAIGIAISVIFLGVKVIRKIVWGA